MDEAQAEHLRTTEQKPESEALEAQRALAVEGTAALNSQHFSETGGFLRETNPEAFRTKLSEINEWRPTAEDNRALEAFDQLGSLPEADIALLLDMQFRRQEAASPLQAEVNKAHVKSVFTGVREVIAARGVRLEPVLKAQPNSRIIELAALVHDVAKWTPKSEQGKPGGADFKLIQHEAEGAIDATLFLELYGQATGQQFPESVVKKIQQIVLRHGEGEFPRDLERKQTKEEQTQQRELFLPSNEADQILNGVDKLVGVNSESFLKYFGSDVRLPLLNARVAGFMRDLGPNATRLDAEFKSYGETMWKNYFRTDSRAVRDTFGREQLAEGAAFRAFVLQTPDDLPATVRYDMEKNKTLINAMGDELPQDPDDAIRSFAELRTIFQTYVWETMQTDEKFIDDTLEDYFTGLQTEIKNDQQLSRLAQSSEAMPGLRADATLVANELRLIRDTGIAIELKQIAARRRSRLPKAA